LYFTFIAVMLCHTFSGGAAMPSVRDLVSMIRQRAGVDAAFVVGRDGLLIDGQSGEGLDGESLAAHVPSLVVAADELGAAARRGGVTTGVFEYPSGLAIVSVLSADAVLLVLARADADVGALLFDLRRNRERLAELV
jgi:predicted regulator of Ras-like GTPase activity (Roadblock/LC7/MglB family)